jgi:hypothetical protein
MRIMALLRPLFGFCLALMLALTSVTMAEARHYGPVGTSVVICANGMAHTITLDGNGHRVPFTHNCPDCIMAAGDMPSALSLPMRPSRGAAIAWVVPYFAKVHAVQLHADARGPPDVM